MTHRFVTFIVDNAHFSILIAFIVVFFGVVSLSRINVAQDPDINYPVVVLQFYLPGAPPERMERNVVYPTEAELRTINGIDSIRSQIGYNYATLVLRFQPHLEAEQKIREVETAINQIKRKLPDALEYSLGNATISNILSAFIITFSAPWLAPKAQEDAARDLIIELQQINALKNINLLEAQQEVVIEVDPARLHRHGLTAEQISNEVKARNTAAVSGGRVLGEDYLRFTGPDKQYQRMEDISRTVLHGADGKALPLSELGVVYSRDQSEQGIAARYNGQPVQLISAGVESSRSNILEVKKSVLAVIAAYQTRLKHPPKIDLVFDQAREVNVLLSSLVNSFFQGMAILFGVLLFSVSLRSTLIISSLLPLSFLMAILLLSFTTFGIQQVSLAGFIIALGLVVDNAIVVVENASVLQCDHGYSPRQAAIEGTAQAIGPLISSTLTTVLAFAPVFLLSSDTTLYLRSLSASIWLSLLASLFISVTVITLLLSRFGSIGSLFSLPEAPSFLMALIPFRDNAYRTLLRFTVRQRFMTLGAFVLLLGGALSLASGIKLEIFPVTGNPYLTVNITLPKHYTDAAKQHVLERVEEGLNGESAVKNFTCVSGTAFPKVNVSMDAQGDLVCLVETRTGEETPLLHLKAALEQRYAVLAEWADINLSLFKFKDPDYRSPFTVVISGSNSQRLQAYGRRIHEALLTLAGIKSVDNPAKSNQPSFQLDFDYARAARLGIDKSQVDLYLAMLTYGYEFDRFRDRRGNEYPLLLKLASGDDIRRALRDILLTGSDGQVAPLSDVVELSLYESESEIEHVNYRPVLEIDIWLKPGEEVEAAATRVMARIEAIEREPDLSVEIGGVLAKKAAQFQGLGKGALLIAALIFSVFVLQFRSFIQPLIVFSAIPFCLIGVVAGLLITGMPITFFAAVGITSLMGIVVNDSILLVDEANRLGREKPELSLSERAIEAARHRFMPILLTSITTVAGLIPLALVDTPFKVMAVTIIGGLTSSTLLLLFLVPALYSFLSSGKQKKQMNNRLLSGEEI
ncbi:MAG: efflux RND transporter permease subunit [Gammaproteobacteria bacterium]|nr:efflux RND transporter permease subunit [Gammaproteobacteria bacterium]